MSWEKPTVLCIENRSDVPGDAIALLRDCGYDVMAVSSSELAMALLSTSLVDGVILASDLHDSDVGALRRQLRDALVDRPVMVFHGGSDLVKAEINLFDAWMRQWNRDARLAHLFDNALAEFFAMREKSAASDHAASPAADSSAPGSSAGCDALELQAAL